MKGKLRAYFFSLLCNICDQYLHCVIVIISFDTTCYVLCCNFMTWKMIFINVKLHQNKGHQNMANSGTFLLLWLLFPPVSPYTPSFKLLYTLLGDFKFPTATCADLWGMPTQCREEDPMLEFAQSLCFQFWEDTRQSLFTLTCPSSPHCQEPRMIVFWNKIHLVAGYSEHTEGGTEVLYASGQTAKLKSSGGIEFRPS